MASECLLWNGDLVKCIEYGVLQKEEEDNLFTNYFEVTGASEDAKRSYHPTGGERLNSFQCHYAEPAIINKVRIEVNIGEPKRGRIILFVI